MDKQDVQLIQSLSEGDSELKQRYQDHVDFERQIELFNAKEALSVEEEVERKRLQKLKLAGKDRIMEILGRHRASPGVSH